MAIQANGSVRNAKEFSVKIIGVIGAGQMGAGVAQVSAASAYQVLLGDIGDGRFAHSSPWVSHAPRRITRTTCRSAVITTRFSRKNPVPQPSSMARP